MDKIYEVNYSANGIIRYAYYKGDFSQGRFYANWIDCNQQNDKLLDSFERDRIKTALTNFFQRKAQ